MIDMGEYFNKQYGDYLKSVSKHRTFITNISKVLTPFLKGDILDMGNGGVFTYDITKANRIVAVDIAFRDISKYKTFPNVLYKYDDARSLKSIPSSSFDTVICQFMLHHITGKSSRDTLRNVRRVMKSAMRVLKPGGTFVIIEAAVPRVVEFFEKLLYQVNTVVFELLGKPMVYMFSHNHILRLIRESGFKSIPQRGGGIYLLERE
jgi:ubiquinone/menaquinone biosynthesis C-methylase UbiE